MQGVQAESSMQTSWYEHMGAHRKDQGRIKMYSTRGARLHGIMGLAPAWHLILSPPCTPPPQLLPPPPPTLHWI